MNIHASATRRRLTPSPVDLALRELLDNPSAVFLARIAAVAREAIANWPEGQRQSRGYLAAMDSHVLCRNEFDNCVFDACLSHDLDRGDVPSSGELIDLLGNVR
jgi:hypothetical protein